MALYFSFALPQATLVCFLPLYVTKFPHNLVQYPVVDLLPSTEPVQSSLTKP